MPRGLWGPEIKFNEGELHFRIIFEMSPTGTISILCGSWIRLIEPHREYAAVIWDCKRQLLAMVSEVHLNSLKS